MHASLYGVLCGLALVAVFTWKTVLAAEEKDERGKFGSLKFCPPGGRSFMMAWTLACEMKRRKRDSGFEVETNPESVPDNLLDVLTGSNRIKRSARSGEMRPATLKEIMQICCASGCEIRDLLPYCDPFGN